MHRARWPAACHASTTTCTRTAARTVVWGDGSAGTATVLAYLAAFRLNGNQSLAFNNPNLTIYGRIPAGQTAATGLLRRHDHGDADVLSRGGGHGLAQPSP